MQQREDTHVAEPSLRRALERVQAILAEPMSDAAQRDAWVIARMALNTPPAPAAADPLVLAVAEASVVLLDADDAMRLVRREGGKPQDLADFFRRSSAAAARHTQAMMAWRQATAALRDARGAT